MFATPTISLYFIRHRSKKILANVLGAGFIGWLMSDGYNAVSYTHLDVYKRQAYPFQA